MDADSEIKKAKWLFGAGLLFLFSCYLTYGELAYLIRGRQTEATITNTQEFVHRGRFGLGGSQRLAVEYTFTEPDGTHRQDSDTVSPEWNIPEKGNVTVQYTPGRNGRSRLAGHVNWFGLALFGISVTVVGVAGYRLWHQAAEATSGRKRKPGR